MVSLYLKESLEDVTFETGSPALGFKKIDLLFHVGPFFPGGGDCLLVRADGDVMSINSNDLIHDLDAYEVREE